MLELSGRWAAACVAAAVAIVSRATPAQRLSPAAIPAWIERAVALGRDTARFARDPDGALDEMRAHALALDPALPTHCDESLDDARGGFIVVHPFGAGERLVTVDCDAGAVLGNQALVAYLLRLSPTPSVRRLVPPRAPGAPASATLDGPITVDRRRRTLQGTNRCCAGSRGTTTVYRVTAGGDLALVSRRGWALDANARERPDAAPPEPAPPAPPRRRS